MVQRIRTRQQFQAAMTGAPVAKTPHFALHKAPLSAGALAAGRCLFPVDAAWVGVVLPKRWAKRAVTRNALRRQIYALTQDLTAVGAWVVRLRGGFARDVFVSASSVALKQAARSELTALLAFARRTPKVTLASQALQTPVVAALTDVPLGAPNGL